MSRKFLLPFILVAIACVASPAAMAGPFGKLKKKAEDTAKTFDKAVEGTSDTPETKPKQDGGAEANGGGSGTSSTAGATGGGSAAVSSVSTKFDFVSGDSVMFYDSFTQDELGEFPARWKLVSGTFEVAEAGGTRWVRCVSAGGQVRMKMPPWLTSTE